MNNKIETFNFIKNDYYIEKGIYEINLHVKENNKSPIVINKNIIIKNNLKKEDFIKYIKKFYYDLNKTYLNIFNTKKFDLNYKYLKDNYDFFKIFKNVIKTKNSNIITIEDKNYFDNLSYEKLNTFILEFSERLFEDKIEQKNVKEYLKEELEPMNKNVYQIFNILLLILVNKFLKIKMDNSELKENLDNFEYSILKLNKIEGIKLNEKIEFVN